MYFTLLFKFHSKCNIISLPLLAMLMKYPALNMQNTKKYKELFKTAISLGKWKKSIVNHLFWSAVSTPNNDGIIIVALV